MSREDLFAHLKEGSAHVCQAWSITRKDGVVFGFTDHDDALQFDGITFLADSGLSARALSASTGLSVDNSEAVGLLQSDGIAEADIIAGRFDGAEVTNWLVQWDDTDARQIRFRGEIGEITREAGQFRVELRGLAERLNQPVGRSFLRSCSAVLGDRACGLDLSDTRLSKETNVLTVEERRTFTVRLSGVDTRWFEQGTLEVLTGDGQGLISAVKHHESDGASHTVTLWDGMRADVRIGDRIRLVAGCDKRAETCRVKFANMINFQGFPDMPGDDWLVAVPRSDGNADGGSLIR